MTDTAEKRLAALTKHLGAESQNSDMFESIPRIRSVAGDSAGPRLRGKVVIITGTNSPLGIGRAVLHQCVRNGARAVFTCDATDTYLGTHKRELAQLYGALDGDAVDPAAKPGPSSPASAPNPEVAAAAATAAVADENSLADTKVDDVVHPPVTVHARRLDAADEAAVAGVVNEALSRYGRVDVVVANAGVVGTFAPFDEIGADDFMKTMQVNALGPFLLAKHGARAMQATSALKPASGGSIVIVSSTAALRANAGPADYSASKAAANSLAQTAAFQFSYARPTAAGGSGVGLAAGARTGIRANTVCPGIVETGMTAGVYAAARARGTEGKIGQLNTLGRGAAADEVARVVLFLASDEASYVNGQSWAVCGGLSAGHPFVPGRIM